MTSPGSVSTTGVGAAEITPPTRGVEVMRAGAASGRRMTGAIAALPAMPSPRCVLTVGVGSTVAPLSGVPMTTSVS
ncbi:MAG: hypothetical protein CMH36_03865 [Microbacterium sp.]|uniref:Uncharacterized protein n=1 Tax=Microbacterium ginsengisoli TaxID=400772 RepID=A0A3C1KFD1_9MICO|nr:hypothetical protein [Microbacterium sp.]HAN25387.1 hypothetical protein [Microbacterium ginsengisoli]